MTLKSIEKLRGYANECWSPWVEAREHLHEMLDAVEAEIAERYMELPCDAEGVPIHPGNYVELDGKGGEVWLVGTTDVMCSDGMSYRAVAVSHRKPDPLIALLDEFATDIANYKFDGVDFDTYAERIRELLGVEQ